MLWSPKAELAPPLATLPLPKAELLAPLATLPTP